MSRRTKPQEQTNPEFQTLIQQADQMYDLMYGQLPRVPLAVIESDDMYPLDPTSIYFPPSWAFRDDTEYVYFLQDSIMHNGLMKVGYTNNWKNRLKQYRTVLPDPKIVAIIPGSRETEERFHWWLRDAEKRHSFREWFQLDVGDIQQVCNSLFCEYEPIDFPVIFL